MTQDVKTPRRYESPHRRDQAARTRRKVVRAAQRLFLRHGYAGTTMAAVAGEAGVVVETVYRSFTSKAGLFGAVVESALAGGADRAEAPVEERPAIAAVIAETDPVRQVALYAGTQPGIHRRAGPLLRAVRDAAAVDREVGGVWRQIERDRYLGQGRFASLLAARGSLRDGLSVAEATDLVWTLTSLAVYDLLVGERRWSSERYERWLSDALVRELLGR